MTALDRFPPLQSAIAQATAWTSYLNAGKDRVNGTHPQEPLASAEDLVRMGIHIGEALPIIWRLAFKQMLVKPGDSPWMTTEESEATRNAIRGLFFTAREALESTRKTAEAFSDATGRRPKEWDRLLTVIDETHQLEENVFR